MEATQLTLAEELGIVKLADVCQLFGMGYPAARDSVAKGKFPIPAFRLGPSQRGPLFVRKDDLTALTERSTQRSAKAASQLTQAGVTKL